MLGAVLLEQGECKEAKEHLSNAKQHSESITAEEFGEAYSGDNKVFYQAGLNGMRKTIQDNLELCKS